MDKKRFTLSIKERTGDIKGKAKDDFFVNVNNKIITSVYINL